MNRFARASARFARLLALIPLAAGAAFADLNLTTANVDTLTVGVADTMTLGATGGTPPYTWSIVSGTPPGMAISASGVYSGTPTTAGAYKVRIQVADSAANVTSAKYAQTVNPAASPSSSSGSGSSPAQGSGGSSGSASSVALSIPYPGINPGTVGVAYNQALYASGGTSPYVWTLASGSLPPGISISGSALVGTPTTSGDYPFQLKLTDAAGASLTNSLDLYITGTSTSSSGSSSNSGGSGSSNSGSSGSGTPTSSPLTIPYPGINPGTVNVAYTQALYASGGKSPYTWTVSSGAPPPGISISGTNLVGTPTQAGDFTFQVKVTDSAGASLTNNLDLYISGPSSGSSSSSGSGGSGSSNSGSSGSGTAAATPLTIPYPGINPGTLNVAYIQALYASGGTPPYAWTVSSGTPPSGISISGTNLTGTPTQSGDFKFQVKVTDTAGASVTNNLDLYITAPSSGSSSGSAQSGPTQYTVLVVGGTLSSGATSGSFPAGTVLTATANSAPSGQVFQGWSGTAVTTPSAKTTTFTLESANVTLTANFVTPAPIPQTIAGHPRLWINQSDLPRLQSWATSTNPIYAQGLAGPLYTSISRYETQYFPGGNGAPTDTPNSTYPDLGDSQGYVGLLSEQDAEMLAFNSLIDPSPARRIQEAQMARNILMYAMNQAAQGVLTGAPFRDPLFPVYNRGNFSFEGWPLAVDWIYSATDASGNPILTAADKATIRSVFLIWAQECISADTTGGDSPSPTGVMNSPQLIPGGNAYRMASNNYYAGHARLLTLMSLALDAQDDPPVDPTEPASALGNSLRSYISDATGAWLFQQFAMMGDPIAVIAGYKLQPGASVGLASGGLPPEGMLYGHSYAYLLGELLALKTAGLADPAIIGPQAALANNAPVWDRFVKGFITSLVPAAQIYPGWAFMGPVYENASYGDNLRLWVTPDFIEPFALLSVLDQKNGDTSRLNAERWFAINAIEGGPSALMSRIEDPWEYGGQAAINYFLLLDPAAPTPTDPRPNYPTAFYDALQGRLVEHTDWTANASLFDYRCSWISINHQEADGNSFEFYRKGEWLTKIVSNYDNNFAGLTTDYHNTIGIQNWAPAGVPANLGWWEGPFWANGSQWQLGEAASDPTVVTSVQPAYTYAYGDATGLYNRTSYWSPQNAALDVQHASRSILWLKPDHIVIYDRATSHTAGLFKKFNLGLISAATPSVGAAANGGTLITTTTPGGQHLYTTSLLPAGANVTLLPVGPELDPIAMLEPTNYRIAITDPVPPLDERFLTVLQGSDAGLAAEPASLIQSSSGTAFDGASVASVVVMFQRTVATPFAGTTFAEPAGTTHTYVTGLGANAGYTVRMQTVGTSVQVSVQPGGSQMTDQAGVLAF